MRTASEQKDLKRFYHLLNKFGAEKISVAFEVITGERVSEEKILEVVAKKFNLKNSEFSILKAFKNNQIGYVATEILPWHHS